MSGMGFCTKCGRPRTGDVRFCTGCGTEFPARPPAERTLPTAALLKATSKPTPATETATPTPSPAPEAATPRDDPAGRRQTAQTIYAEPIKPTWSPPPTPPAPASPPHTPSALASSPPAQAAAALPPYTPPAPTSPPPSGPATPERGPGNARTLAFITAGLVIVLAAGGGAYALVSRASGHATARQSTHPTVTADASTAPSTAQASASPAASPSTSPSPSATPSTTPTPTPSPTQTEGVQVAAGVASTPEEPRVAAYLNRYFSSINTRNYNEYNSLLDAQEQQSDSQSSFNSGFASTKDSNEVLTGIQDTGGGDVTATVSFTSHQNPADSVNGSACNDWQISLFLVPNGNS